MEEGKISELNAKDILKKYFGKKYEVEFSSKEEDIFQHIDIYLIDKNTGKRIGIDVKDKAEGLDEYQFVEYSNVNGKAGWIFGKAKYIMFKTSTQWLLVERKDLLIACNKKWGEYKSQVQYDKYLVKEYDFYTRVKYDRNDMMMKVPINYIIELSKYKLKI